MDSYRDFPSDFEPAGEAEPCETATLSIGTDERRMHVRAYNYWVSLLDGRDYPSIEDLEPADLVDFAPHSVLLDFTAGRDNPATPYVGAAIKEECGLETEVRTIADVPSRSLLSRLTDHYMQIVANRAPVGFEAEFVNQRGENLCYRGIMMPFSSDGETIDFIYGVINWKSVDGRQSDPPAPPAAEVEQAVADQEPLELTDAIVPFADPQADDEDVSHEAALGGITLDEGAGLADLLWAARESAESARDAEGRSRTALYRALAFAYDFALAGKAEPEDYAELLEESGVKAQARAPMTPVVKLVFGIDYDKARLTEYAAALSYAERQDVGPGGFLAFIEAQAGGLKALVAAERQARRPEPKADTVTDRARERLRAAAPLSLGELPAQEEFALILTRRREDGGHEPVALVDDPALVERAIRRAAA
ncbi:MAG TPA: hypothetical protein VFO51_09055 [Sphingomicrobium sp.]|nr:hypothetical protein [Sphingomicrobium sp.]